MGYMTLYLYELVLYTCGHNTINTNQPQTSNCDFGIVLVPVPTVVALAVTLVLDLHL